MHTKKLKTNPINFTLQLNLCSFLPYYTGYIIDNFIFKLQN